MGTEHLGLGVKGLGDRAYVEKALDMGLGDGPWGQSTNQWIWALGTEHKSMDMGLGDRAQIKDWDSLGDRA